MNELCRQVVLRVTSEYQFFNPIRGSFQAYTKEIITTVRSLSIDTEDTEEKKITSKKLIKDFILAVAAIAPEKRSSILGLIQPFAENPQVDSVRFFYELLKSLTFGSGEHVENMAWRELPRILKKEEIFWTEDRFSALSLRETYNLKQVSVQGPYESVH